MDDRPETVNGVRPLFEDRRQAGAKLAQALVKYRGAHALVLGVPRGGVPVAAEVARALDAELDVVIARKLGAPGMPELAIGAVTANGGRYLHDELIGELQVPPSYIEKITAEQRADARRRECHFRGGRALAAMRGRVVIIVDDGLATGATMKAAVRSVRKRNPDRLVVAVPVGDADSCAALRREADEVVCLYELTRFGAVGSYYADFEPTRDEEVQELLSATFSRRGRDELMTAG